MMQRRAGTAVDFSRWPGREPAVIPFHSEVVHIGGLELIAEATLNN
jgi:hypothetical protein